VHRTGQRHAQTVEKGKGNRKVDVVDQAVSSSWRVVDTSHGCETLCWLAIVNQSSTIIDPFLCPILSTRSFLSPLAIVSRSTQIIYRERKIADAEPFSSSPHYDHYYRFLSLPYCHSTSVYHTHSTNTVTHYLLSASVSSLSSHLASPRHPVACPWITDPCRDSLIRIHCLHNRNKLYTLLFVRVA